MARPLVVLKQAYQDPWNTPAERQKRALAYILVLLQEAKVDVKRVAPGDAMFAMASPYEQRGYSSADVERWINECDPPTKKPTWDPIACFREKAHAAMKPRPGLGAKLALIGGGTFLAAYFLMRRR